MRTKALFAAIVTSWAASAAACGFCIEDKVASVYDQAVVEKAVKDKRHIAFFAIETDAPIASGKVTAALQSAGTVRGTARVSMENHAVAVVFDPKKTSVEQLERAANKMGVPVKALQVIDEGGKLKDAAVGS